MLRSVPRQEMIVVREGTLYLSINASSTSSKDWRPYLFVLRHSPELKRSTFDYYKDLNKRWQKQSRKGNIELWPSFQVSLAHSSSYKFPIKITTADQKDVYYLAASTFEDMNMWYNSLQMQSYLVQSSRDYFEFPVQPKTSISTTMIGAVGDCILAFTPQKQIVCALSPSYQIIGVWPYNCLRKYWGGRDHFGFLSGRRSPRGEGEFVFITKRGEEIYRILKRIIKLESPVEGDARLPAALPQDPTRSDTPVSSSESDSGNVHTYSPPPIPAKPPDLLYQLSSLGPLPLPPIPKPEERTSPLGLENTEISETSPAYMVRAGTTTSSTSRNPMSSPTRAPLPGHVPEVPPQVVPNDDEDTYSHATHTLPKHFSRNPSMKIIEGGSTYNGLVRSDSNISRTNRDLSHSRPASESDTQLYDLAYPPRSEQPIVLAPVFEGDYGSMGDPNQNKTHPNRKMRFSDRQGANPQGGVESMDTGAAVARPQHLEKQTSEGLTDNPLYGSKENILTDFVEIEGAPPTGVERSGYDQNLPGVGYQGDMVSALGLDLEDSMIINPVYELHKSDVTDGKMGGVSDAAPRCTNPLEDSLMTNPIYTDHGRLGTTLQNTKTESLNSNNSREMKPVADSLDGTIITATEPAKITDGNDIVEHSDQDGSCSAHGKEIGEESKERGIHIARDSAKTEDELSKSEGNVADRNEGDNIPPSARRDLKGYSKVNKTPEGNNEFNDEGSPPPPLPPRKYSNESPT